LKQECNKKFNFSSSLSAFPSYDKPSNLIPSNPNDIEGIESPDVQGSINLSELFQIATEGAER